MSEAARGGATLAGEHWIVAAEAVLAGRAAPGEDVDVLRGESPPLVDAALLGALGQAMLAAIIWAATVFREQVTEAAIDPLLLLLRLLALGLSVRTALLFDARRHALVIAPEGLLLRTPSGDVPLPKAWIVGVVERGDWRARAGRRTSEVYVVTAPESGRTHVALPPIFDATPGVLAERLMRWRGAVPGSDADRPEPVRLASKLYDEVAAGARPEGVAVIRHGRGWLVRGPYASVLLGVAVLVGFARLPEGTLALVGPLAPVAIGVCLALVPALWMWLVRREIRPRRGLALVLTPAEALMRARAGVVRVAWRAVARLSVETKSAWSLLEGHHGARHLLLARRNEPEVRYDEAYLGVPAEVALALCEAYRRGALPLGTAGDGDVTNRENATDGEEPTETAADGETGASGVA
jgi:hypothetical protein